MTDRPERSAAVAKVRSWLQDPLVAHKPDVLWRVVLMMLAAKPSGIDRLIELAKLGKPVADMLLCEAGARYLHTTGEIPEPIRTYIGTKLAHISIGEDWPEPVKHDKARKTIARDLVIVLIMAKLIQQGYSATRSSAAKHDCAASIIAEAGVCPPIGEDGVADVWRRCGWIAELFEGELADPNTLH
jgi:hypothetical protein